MSILPPMSINQKINKIMDQLDKIEKTMKRIEQHAILISSKPQKDRRYEYWNPDPVPVIWKESTGVVGTCCCHLKGQMTATVTCPVHG